MHENKAVYDRKRKWVLILVGRHASGLADWKRKMILFLLFPFPLCHSLLLIFFLFSIPFPIFLSSTPLSSFLLHLSHHFPHLLFSLRPLPFPFFSFSFSSIPPPPTSSSPLPLSLISLPFLPPPLPHPHTLQLFFFPSLPVSLTK